MSGFKVNFSVNNQLSTPSIHAAPFAQRPAAGQPGRVFIDSDNPSTGIYRDTGTTWVAIGNPSSPDVDTLQIVTGRGNTTTNSITVGAATTPSGTVDVRRSTAALNGTNDWAFIGVNTPTIPSGASFGVNYVNAVYGSQAQTFAGNATIGNTGLNSAGNFINTLGNSASGTITVAQGSGTIRAIAGLHAGIYYNTPNAMTFTHVAGIRTLQPINSGAVGASVTNYYGVQIGDSTPSSGTISYTNRWGIYQEGASDLNYFAARVGFGTTTIDTTSAITIDSGSFANTIWMTSASGDQHIQSSNTTGTIRNGIILGQNGINMGGGPTFRNAINVFRTSNNVNIFSGTDTGHRLSVSGTAYIQTSLAIARTSAARTLDVQGNGYVRGDFDVLGSLGASRSDGTNTSIIFDNTGNVQTTTMTIRCGNGTLSSKTNTITFTNNDATPQSWLIGENGNNNFSFRNVTSASTAILIDTSNNVGIATTSPAAKLHLNGTLRIDGQSSGTAGGSSGQHLIINLDGTTYKIALLNP